MYPSLILSAALITPAAPVPRDATPNTLGPAPRVLSLKADPTGAVRVTGYIPTKRTVTSTYWVVENNNNQPVQKQVEHDIISQEYFNKSLAEFNAKFSTAEGTELTLTEATSRMKKGATVLVSSDGKPISKAWLRAAAPDTVVMVADDFTHVQTHWGGTEMPTTPAPQLAMLGTNERGKLMAPCTSQPLNGNNNYYYGDWEGVRAIQFNGRGRGGYIGYNNMPLDAKVEFKPLADVQFDAFDLTGKRIPRGETLKRLAAGGMVVVAGDNRMPDEAYLKGLHKDTIVLTGPELVLPVPPVDKTKKKEQEQKAKEKEQPAQKALAPVAPAQPAVQIQILPVIKGK